MISETTTPGGQVGQPSLVPIPDPSARTTDAIALAVVAGRDHVAGLISIISQRLDAMDRATALLNSQVTAVPSDVDKQVGNLKELHSERFKSIELQFIERDKRSERESRDNKVAVDAAFAAQKEAAAEQNKSNTLAISKSEVATTEAIRKLEQLVQAAIDGLNDKISALGDRLNRTENLITGAAENRAGSSKQLSTVLAVGSLMLILVSVSVAIIVATRH